ncbi:serine/arginine repetitive matrix protein 3-like [Sciurus carolinensis]|uniref:serine/arginine repetitive matrix protein 3-like n=1 Tax=Sciurus carolinensis TaxID=30640 RepID=UPI001FB4CC33|nr:serine/arginine repetitive matrix protein 3-like [Sciurus carolinensis]
MRMNATDKTHSCLPPFHVTSSDSLKHKHPRVRCTFKTLYRTLINLRPGQAGTSAESEPRGDRLERPVHAPPAAGALPRSSEACAGTTGALPGAGRRHTTRHVTRSSAGLVCVLVFQIRTRRRGDEELGAGQSRCQRCAGGRRALGAGRRGERYSTSGKQGLQRGKGALHSGKPASALKHRGAGSSPRGCWGMRDARARRRIRGRAPAGRGGAGRGDRATGRAPRGRPSRRQAPASIRAPGGAPCPLPRLRAPPMERRYRSLGARLRRLARGPLPGATSRPRFFAFLAPRSPLRPASAEAVTALPPACQAKRLPRSPPRADPRAPRPRPSFLRPACRRAPQGKRAPAAASPAPSKPDLQHRWPCSRRAEAALAGDRHGGSACRCPTRARSRWRSGPKPDRQAPGSSPDAVRRPRWKVPLGKRCDM